jgi:hypothetical protein
MDLHFLSGGSAKMLAPMLPACYLNQVEGL